jgi:hypothetical protein
MKPEALLSMHGWYIKWHPLYREETRLPDVHVSATGMQLQMSGIWGNTNGAPALNLAGPKNWDSFLGSP